MTSVSTAPETRDRIAAMADRLTNPDHKAMMAIWLDHWWGEVIYDIAPVMRTLSPDVMYRSYGARTFGDTIAIDGHDQARAMYLSLFDAGLMPGGPIDDEKFYFGDQGVMFEGVFTSVFPGQMMPGVPGLKPEELYLVSYRMAVSHPFDLKAGVMKGEILYPGPLMSIEPSDRATIARLLGR